MKGRFRNITLRPGMYDAAFEKRTKKKWGFTAFRNTYGCYAVWEHLVDYFQVPNCMHTTTTPQHPSVTRIGSQRPTTNFSNPSTTSTGLGHRVHFSTTCSDPKHRHHPTPSKCTVNYNESKLLLASFTNPQHRQQPSTTFYVNNGLGLREIRSTRVFHWL